MTDSRSIHVSTNDPISFFLWLSNIPLCVCIYIQTYIYKYTHTHTMHTPHLLYLFLCWWTFRLLPCPGYCKLCRNKHWGVLHVPLWIMVFSGSVPRSGTRCAATQNSAAQWVTTTTSHTSANSVRCSPPPLLWAGSALAHVSSMDFQYPDKSLRLIMPVCQEEH